ncbi:MAG: hypothetical protein M3066_16220 [Actinomycetota bacterium]|nr:hypothetical protein [Actinomycetota bacterium]
MSTFWTPSGERPIPRDEPAGPPASGPRPGPGDPEGYGDDYSEEEMRAEMLAMQEQLLRTPAAVVVANHGIALLELAAVHLGQEPPRLADASVAIDALSGILDAVGPRMGENEAPLRQALHQLRMAFVEAKTASAG